MAAWLMSVYFNGLDENETNYYTTSIINSGKKLQWNHLNGFVLELLPVAIVFLYFALFHALRS